MARPHPPGVALWIVERLTPARDRDAVIGDLVEDFYRIAERDPAAARRWCRRQAMRSLMPGLRRQCRDAAALTLPSEGRLSMRGFLQDLRFGLRLLRHQPTMAAAGMLSLTVGLGLNLLLFTLANAILLRPLPVDGADRLVVLGKQRELGVARDFSYPAFTYLRDQARGVLDTVVAFSGPQLLARANGGDAEWIQGQIVSGNLFTDLKIRMAQGRPLTPDDDRDAAPPAAVVSHRYWARRFAGETLAGQTITLNDRTFTIAGVADPSFLGLQLGRDASVWIPIAHAAAVQGRDLRSRPTTSWLNVLGRLAPGTTAESAAARLSPAWTTYAGSLGYGHETVILADGSQGDAGLAELRGPLRLLSAASLFVLLIACVNVANLQLARAAARAPEFAVRAALGAGRARLGSLLLADAVILTVPASLAALAAAAVLREPASALIARFGQPVTLDLSLDARVGAAALGLTVATALLVGGVSAWLGTRKAPAAAVAGAGRASVGGAARTQRALVIVQFALSMALVAGAGLLVRTVSQLRSSDIGFVRTIALLEVSPGGASVTPEAASRYFERGADRLRRLPGVENVAVAAVMPLDFGGSRRTITVPGYTPAQGEDMELNYNRISPEYFEVMGIPVVEGRAFDARDTANQPRRVIINETLAGRYFPGGRALGRSIAFGSGPADMEIVGIVRDARYRMVREAPRPSFYVPMAQEPAPFGAFHVRTSGDPSRGLGEMERALAGLDPGMAVDRVLTLDDQLDRNISGERMARSIALTLGIAALLLAATGLYATMAFAVRRRTREIGVRMALGARARDVRLMIVRQSLMLVGAGVAAGLAGAVWAGRAVESQLYGVSPVDAASLGGAALVLGVAALVATWLPARRAMRVDPVVALRDS